MAISWIWAGMVILSLFCGLYTGNLDDVASAALNGAQSAVELSFSMAGVLCLCPALAILGISSWISANVQSKQ